MGGHEKADNHTHKSYLTAVARPISHRRMTTKMSLVSLTLSVSAAAVCLASDEQTLRG